MGRLMAAASRLCPCALCPWLALYQQALLSLRLVQIPRLTSLQPPLPMNTLGGPLVPLPPLQADGSPQSMGLKHFHILNILPADGTRRQQPRPAGCSGGSSRRGCRGTAYVYSRWPIPLHRAWASGRDPCMLALRETGAISTALMLPKFSPQPLPMLATLERCLSGLAG